MSVVAYVVYSCACVAFGFAGKPKTVAVVGMLSVLLIVVLSLMGQRQDMLFLLVPITSSYLIALLRAGKTEPRAALGVSFVPLFAVVTVGPAVVVFLVSLLAVWRGNALPRLWASVGSAVPACVAIFFFVEQRV